MTLFRIQFVSILLCLSSIGSFAQADTNGFHSSDSVQVINTVNHFVKVFANLQWKEFTECFADQATAFFPPSAKFSNRADNKKAIENIFRIVFENARKQNPSAPYLKIEPKELKIQLVGSVAIVTFLLDDPGMLGRRTIVLEKNNNDWKIIHLHASGVAVSK